MPQARGDAGSPGRPGPGPLPAAGAPGQPGEGGPGAGDAGTEGLPAGGPDAERPGPGGPARPDQEDQARQICQRLLANGPRTRAQLAGVLRRRRVPGEVAEAVLSRYAEVGLIDDAAFARAWVESRHHGRGLASRALSAELRRRGVGAGEIRAAVGLLDPGQEIATARRLVAKRLPTTRGRPLPARVRHLLGMLARKGYPPGMAAQVVREALAAEAETAGMLGSAAGWDVLADLTGDGPPPELEP